MLLKSGIGAFNVPTASPLLFRIVIFSVPGVNIPLFSAKSRNVWYGISALTVDDNTGEDNDNATAVTRHFIPVEAVTLRVNSETAINPPVI
ncbi:TPA: hypothetical protein J5G20_004515 [Escherichia coli]|nr:hypothetical protein [Escherichia coli]HBA3905590.1 hypothetical protein [Escherichia coli]